MATIPDGTWQSNRQDEIEATQRISVITADMAKIGQDVQHWSAYPGGGYDSKKRLQRLLTMRAKMEALGGFVDKAIAALEDGGVTL